MSVLARLAAAAVLLVSTSLAALAWPATVLTDLNMRSGPGTGYGVILILPRGVVIDVLGCQANWCEVTYANTVGYVSQTFIGPAEARPVVPPSPSPGLSPRPPYPGGPQRPEHPRRQVCDEAGAMWAIGRHAGDRTVERARRDANARSVRIIHPDMLYTTDYERRRLNIEVNHRNRIVDLSCG
jgi:hypothetical protein